jgi:hypothetical protein
MLSAVIRVLVPSLRAPRRPAAIKRCDLGGNVSFTSGIAPYPLTVGLIANHA